ncbi:MAG: TolC family protein [Planctomycetota bacterium]
MGVRRGVRRASVLAAIAGAAVWAGTTGCSSPVGLGAEDDLRRSVLESVRRELAESEGSPQTRLLDRAAPSVPATLSPDIVDELNQMAGPDAYRYDVGGLPVSTDLLGRPQPVVAIDLRRAVRTGVARNLDIEFARIAPAIAESDVVEAAAAFDWLFVQNLEWANTDTEVQTQTAIFSAFDARQTITSTTGVQRTLTTGGRFTLEQQMSYIDNYTIGNTEFFPDPGVDVTLRAELQQPLLRNFGSDVSLAQVRINRNQERNSIAALRATLLDTILNIEVAYWDVWQAHRNVLIIQKLLDRGIEVRDQLEQRRIIDATPAQVADATSRVENRKRLLLIAQNNLRAASDQLKLLMNDPELSVGSETLLLPSDRAVDEAIYFSKLDALARAIEERPEVQQALLSLDNTAINQSVADNQRLPQLDARLELRYNALEDNVGDAYEEIADGELIDYLAGLFFSQPIGNRAAEAQFRQRRLERMQASVSYRNTIRNIVFEVKRSLDDVSTFYQLVEQTRDARLAAAEVLRALLVEKDTIGAFDVQSLDLELNRQESLSQREQDEVQALADYMRGLAALHDSMGTSLERNQIDFVVPDADEVFTSPNRTRVSNAN